MIASIAQINPFFGNIKRNIEKHLTYISLAKEGEAKLVIFPELSLTGYYLKDLVPDYAIGPSFEVIKPILNASNDIDIVISFPEKGEDFNYYISSAYLSKGEIISIHRKVYPPITGMFDDLKDFKRGDKITTFSANNLTTGMLICRDMWHPEAVIELAMNDAKLIIVPSAVPLRSINENSPNIKPFIDRSVIFYAEHYSLYFVFANRVGFEEGICFYGGSTVASPSGEIILSMSLLTEEIKFFEINEREIERRVNILPLQFEQRRDIGRYRNE
jgi:predicted amidohydrolase